MIISTRDFTRLVLREAGRYYFVDAVQIRGLINEVLTQRAVTARCDRMVKNGLLRRLDSGVRICWTPTQLGLDLSGRTYRPIQRLAPYRARHTAAVADVGVALTVGGELVRTERELWAAQTWNRTMRGLRWCEDQQRHDLLLPSGYPITGGDYEERRTAWLSAWNVPHMPDLECWVDGERIAVEVELTQKTHARVREIMRYYGSRRSRYKTVAYCCETPSIRRQVERWSAECAPELELLTYLPTSDLCGRTLTTWDDA